MPSRSTSHRRAAATALLAAASLLAAGRAAAEIPLVEVLEQRDFATARLLLAEEADPNAAASDGTTPLHWAVYHDDAGLVGALIAAGADVTAANDYGATPMSEAAVTGNVAVLEMLLDAGADVDSPNAEGQTALMALARTSNTTAARLLIERGADVNARERWKDQTALMWAAAERRPTMVRLLVEHGAEVGARSKTHDWKRQVTAEPRAKHLPSGGMTPLLYAARSGCVACTETLVLAGADVNRPDPDAVTPLLLALLNANFDVAKYLLESGANASKWDWWGRNPLYAAVDYNTIPHGGRPDQPSLDETTALDMIERLLNAGANPNAQLKLLQPFRSLGADRGADPILGPGTTPLIRAAKAGDAAAVKLLLDAGAHCWLAQETGVTPLMAAAGLRSYAIDTRGRFRTQAGAVETIGLLLDAGADVGARDTMGQTALHGAAFQGWDDVVRLLVERGADPAAVDDFGATVADAALGRMRGRGRGANEVEPHPDTAALVEQLVTAR